jgi:site-specific DNA recombinase
MARRVMRNKATDPAESRVVRCAVYTRKSTDEGLERDFNSLDAQRETCEAFIQSQKHEGWRLLPDRYDDGGYTGASMERPALKRLLADVELGRIDVIVIYKLDRLSRSVRDYLNLLAELDQHGVEFVSVTQQFNTTTPVGRMTLRMLLSFAEFERDMISDRTRDKVRAARRHGKWTGGHPPLGYDVAPEGRRLVVNESEANQVRAIFGLYLERQSLIDVANELNRRGWRTKTWVTREGKPHDGATWSKTNVARLLNSPIYIGRQMLGDEDFDGEHDAIVPAAVFETAQQILEGNHVSGGATSRNQHGALLRGLLRCGSCDCAMTHVWTRRGSRTHRYYRCQRAQKLGKHACPTGSIQARAIEDAVVERIALIGRDPELQAETLRQAEAQIASERQALLQEAARLERDLTQARKQTSKLAAAVAKSKGNAQGALIAEVEIAQGNAAKLQARLNEIAQRIAALNSAVIDPDDLARALSDFTPLWNQLVTVERERLLRQIVRSVSYDRPAEKLVIELRVDGIAGLAEGAVEAAV